MNRKTYVIILINVIVRVQDGLIFLVLAVFGERSMHLIHHEVPVVHEEVVIRIHPVPAEFMETKSSHKLSVVTYVH